MFKVGIAGGIGSGKSTISTIFKVLGVPVFDADTEAKKLMNENVEIKEALIKFFGREIYKDELLDRKMLAKIVFNSKEKLEQLNNIVHPITIKASNDWALQQNASYVIKEAALMFESESYKSVDVVIGVIAPKELRMKRVIQRDKVSAKEVDLRMSKQNDEEITKKRSNYIIINDEQHLIVPQVLELHQKFSVGKI